MKERKLLNTAVFLFGKHPENFFPNAKLRCADEYDSVNIAIFKNRLEIRSPGGLYGGLTIEKIRAKEVSASLSLRSSGRGLRMSE